MILSAYIIFKDDTPPMQVCQAPEQPPLHALHLEPCILRSRSTLAPNLPSPYLLHRHRRTRYAINLVRLAYRLSDSTRQSNRNTNSHLQSVWPRAGSTRIEDRSQ